MTKDPCPHLEALLPKPNSGILPTHNKAGKNSFNVRSELRDYYINNIENNLKVPEFESRVKSIEGKLQKLGLEDFRIELLIDRFVSQMTLGEIADKYGYVSGSAVQHILTSTLKMLSRLDPKMVRKWWST